MWKIFKCVLLLVAIIGVVDSIPGKKKEKDPNMCHWPSPEVSWPVGQIYVPPGECQGLLCESPKLITVKNCQRVKKRKNASCQYVEQNNAKDYPECCPRMNCPA